MDGGAMSLSSYMIVLYDELMAGKRIEESTAITYLRNLYVLNDKAPFNNLAFLRDVDGIMAKIEPYALTTRRNLLAAVCSVLSLQKSPIYVRLYEVYSRKLKAAQESLTEARGDTMVPTAKEKENWITWEEIQKTRDKLKAYVARTATASRTSLDATEFGYLLQYLLVSLYTYLPPRRNMDYSEMTVVPRWTDNMAKTMNYLDLAGKRFVFNVFKTAKSTGQQIVDIPPELMSIIETYLRFHPYQLEGKDIFPFLVRHSGIKFPASNGITRILNKAFKKKVGSSMLRHIYLTQKYGGAMESMRKDATAMAHDEAVQRTYIRGPSVLYM